MTDRQPERGESESEGLEGSLSRASPTLDVELLSGFDFNCLPNCGLCCFTSPRLSPGDEARLLARAPEAKVVSRAGERCIAARPQGGACQFLRETKCLVHDARPAPCREFPVSVHVGTRLQATVVLTCPGVPIHPLTRWSARAPAGQVLNFRTELESVRARVAKDTSRKLAESLRRRRRILRSLDAEGRWVDEDRVREQLGRSALAPSEEQYDVEDPPSGNDELELLPMYFDGRVGPVALALGLGGWEARELSADGGFRALGLAAPPVRRPTMDEEATGLLEGYLHYVLARDSFLAAVHLELSRGREGNVTDAAREDLRTVGSLVLARGSVRAKLRGASGALLGKEDVERGIRATDLDWLDRPTWGSRL